MNQITDFSSQGISSPDATEDVKPDVVAPGGSAFYTSILSVDTNNSDAESISFADVQANDYTPMMGTSMAAPFVSGASALVIQALEQSGLVWNFNSDLHPRLVKMLLCASATETNSGREASTGNDPSLGRAASPKDLQEGYGIINPDAAIQAILIPFFPGSAPTSSTTGGRFDPRCFGRYVNLTAGTPLNLTLDVPSTGDLDLYLYSSTPSANGTPVVLASSATAGNGSTEAISYTPVSSGTAYLFVKRVSGSGSWTLFTTSNTPQILSLSPTSIAAGSGTSTLTVIGTNFRSNSVVNWNGSPLTTTFVSPTRLTASVPAANLASAGNATITVTNPTQGTTSNAVVFTIGRPIVTAALFSLTHDDTGYHATLQVTNRGSAAATSVRITAASLLNRSTGAPAVGTSTPLPQTVGTGTLAAGSSATVVLDFPASAGVGGQQAELSFNGAFAEGSFNGTVRKTLP